MLLQGDRNKFAEYFLHMQNNTIRKHDTYTAAVQTLLPISKRRTAVILFCLLHFGFEATTERVPPKPKKLTIFAGSCSMCIAPTASCISHLLRVALMPYVGRFEQPT